MKLFQATLLVTTARLSLLRKPPLVVRAFSTTAAASVSYPRLLGSSGSTAFESTTNILSMRPLAKSYSSTTSLNMAKKEGVADLEELQQVVEAAGDDLLVVDVRNPDASVEPGDQKSLSVAGLPTTDFRPCAKHYIWDRTENKLLINEHEESWLKGLPKDTPIITHCGGGGRGQKAKDYLMEKFQFTNVHNGGGPKEQDLWKVYGEK
jgi:rhodanese-related sulfurtransferase